MKRIDISTPKYPNKFTIVDDKDYKWLSQWKWHACKDHNRNQWYVRRGDYCNGKMKSIQMHSVIMNTPKGMQTDHINHNPLDNRRNNLRICTASQNGANRKKNANCHSPYKGVTLNDYTKKWTARVCCDKKRYCLGYFVNEKDAARAYNRAALKLFGEFACLNNVAN